MMKTGDFNPHFFDYPVALHVRRRWSSPSPRFLVGAMRGPVVVGLAQRRRQPTSTCGDAPSRRCSARPRSSCVYRAGMRWGARTALLAAGAHRGDAAARPRVALRADRRAGDVLRDADVPAVAGRARTRHARPVCRRGGGRRARRRDQIQRSLALVMPLIACWMTPSAQALAARGVAGDRGHRRVAPS